MFASDDGTIDFNKEIRDYYGVIPKKRKEQYVNHYLVGIEKWSKLLYNTGGDPYLTILNPLYKMKREELELLYLNNTIDMDDFQKESCT